MKVGLDVRMIQFSGIGTTIRGLLDHLPAERLRQMTLYGPSNWANPYPCELRPADDPVYGAHQHWRYGRFLNREKLSVYHMPHYDVPLSYRGRFVATVHDLIHFLFPQFSTKPFTRAYSWFLLRHVTRRAERIITVSENTKKDLIRLFPQSEPKVEVIYPAVDRHYTPIGNELMKRVMREHRLEPGYLLYVGNLREGKNTRRLIRVYMDLKRRRDLPPLVLVGKNSLTDLDLSKYEPHIRAIGTVSFHDLPAIYSAASVFLFPTLYEGFGLPPLEAMACGTPVIVSNVSSLPEVCADAAEYVDPASDQSLSQAIERLVDSGPRRAELREAGLLRAKKFSWRTFADRTWRIYEDVGRTVL